MRVHRRCISPHISPYLHLRCAFWRLAESLGARCCRRRDAALVATRPRHVRAMSTAGAQCHRKWDATFITHVVAGEMRAEALQPCAEWVVKAVWCLLTGEKRSGSVERAVKEGVHAVSKAPAVAPSAHLGSSRRISDHLGASRIISAHLGASRRISAHLVHAASEGVAATNRDPLRGASADAPVLRSGYSTRRSGGASSARSSTQRRACQQASPHVSW